MTAKNEWILSYNNRQEVLKLPVNPNDYAIHNAHNNETKTNFELGDIKLIGNRKLEKLRIESFFPKQYYPFCTYRDFPEPQECIKMIKRWKNSRRPIRVVITGTEVNTAYAIDSIEESVQDGTGDIYFSLDLEEYVFANTKDSNAGGSIDSTTGLMERWEDPRERKEIVHTVKEDTNVWDIFIKEHGTGYEYDDLANFVKLNKDNIDEGWNVKAGTELVIPNVIQR